MSIFTWLFVGYMLAGSLVYALLSRSLRLGLGRLPPHPTLLQPPSSDKAGPTSGEFPHLSILVAARNEANHLPLLLRALLGQDYPADRFDIWIIDDRSSDETPEILKTFADRHPGRVFTRRVQGVPPGISPKKNALALALAEAQGDILVTTDADCLMSPLWLRTLVAHFTPGTGLVLGLTTYTRTELRNYGETIADLEFASYAFVAAALVGLGFPVTGNANNIAYRREAHADQQKTLRHDHLISGDDDFLLQGIHATGKWGITYMTSPESAVTTAPPDHWRHFWEQRKRWASKCMHYQPRQVIFLSLIFVYFVGILLALPLGWMQAIHGWVALWVFGLAFGIKTLCDYQVMRAASRLFRQEHLMRGFVGAALLHIPLIVSAVVAGSLGSFTWKGQAFKTKA